MLEHFRIISAVINLVIGTGIVFSYLQRYRRFRHPYLVHLMRYTLFYGVLLFFYILAKYVDLNLSGPELRNRIPLLSAAALTITAAMYGTMVHYIDRVHQSFLGRSGKNLFSLLIPAGIVCALAHVLLTALLSEKNTALPGILIGLGFGLLLFSEVGLYQGLIRAGRREKNPDTLSRSLGWYMLSRYFFLIIVFLTIGLFAKWTIPESIAPLAAFVVLLYITAVPGIWLEKKFIPAATSFSSLMDADHIVTSFCRRYKISKREEDLVRLLFDGKSNQEIEETLFISYHTVKNHLYNVYRKLGIKNRYELVHRIARFREQQQPLTGADDHPGNRTVPSGR